MTSAAQNGKFVRFEGGLRTNGNVNRSQQLCKVVIRRFCYKTSFSSLSLTVAKWSVKNVPFGTLAPCVICYEVSSPSGFFQVLFGGDWLLATFWRSELEALNLYMSYKWFRLAQNKKHTSAQNCFEDVSKQNLNCSLPVLWNTCNIAQKT